MAEFTLWFMIVVLAHIFYALVFIIDKNILSKSLPHPIVYAFYVGVMSGLVLVLVPFSFSFPSFYQILLIFIGGSAQVAGWVLMYRALSRAEISRVVPLIGSFIAIFTLILSKFLIGESLGAEELIAFMFLVLGSLILSVKEQTFWERPLRYIFYRRKTFFALSLLSALLFAIYWVITKYIFLSTAFVTGIIWMRTGAALMALTLIIPKKNRKLIFQKTKKAKSGTIKFVFIARILSVFGAVGIYLAVFLGSVTLTNSLQGVQYIFVLILAFVFYKKYPSLKEQFSRDILVQKIIAILLIGAGLAILVI